MGVKYKLFIVREDGENYGNIECRIGEKFL